MKPILLYWRNSEAGEYLTAEGQVISGTWSSLKDTLQNRPVALVIPTEAVLLTPLNVVGPRRDWPELARYQLEEQLIAEVEDYHIALSQRANPTLWVAAVLKSEMRHWLATLQAVNFDPVAVYPDVLLLPRNSVIVPDLGGRYLFWNGEHAFAGDEITLSQWLPSAGFTDALSCEWPPNAETVSLPSFDLRGDELDLRQGEWAKSTAWEGRTWGVVIGLFLGVMLLHGVYAVGARQQLHREQHQLTQQMEQLLRQTAPQIQRIVNPRAQLEGLLRQASPMETAADFFTLLAVVTAPLRTATALTLQSLDYQTGQLVLQLEGGTPTDIETFGQAFNPGEGLQIDLETRRREQTTETRLRLTRGRP